MEVDVSMTLSLKKLRFLNEQDSPWWAEALLPRDLQFET